MDNSRRWQTLQPRGSKERRAGDEVGWIRVDATVAGYVVTGGVGDLSQGYYRVKQHRGSERGQKYAWKTERYRTRK